MYPVAMPTFDISFTRVNRDEDSTILDRFFRTVEWPVHRVVRMQATYALTCPLKRDCSDSASDEDQGSHVWESRPKPKCWRLTEWRCLALTWVG
jgi:hypothetical protein